MLTNEGENNRYRALPPSFLSARANGNNSSEGATSTLNSCKDKSLLVLEELPSGDLDTSLVKTLTANDELSARALYKDSTQFVPRGKLLVNTNHSPKTQDTALWDRMVLIPFDVRYAGDGEEVDDDNWLLASDAAKVDELKELKDAFVTVCLKDYHLLRKTNPTEIPLPACVREMMKQRRQESMPLGQFMDKFTSETKVPELYSAALAIFQAYRHHRRSVMREYDQDNTYTKFMESLRRLNKFDIVMNDKDQEFVVGRALIPEGQDMARKESDNQPFGVYHDKSIISAFKRQEDRVNRKRMREMDVKENPYEIAEIPGSMTPTEFFADYKRQRVMEVDAEHPAFATGCFEMQEVKEAPPEVECDPDAYYREEANEVPPVVDDPDVEGSPAYMAELAGEIERLTKLNTCPNLLGALKDKQQKLMTEETEYQVKIFFIVQTNSLL